MDVRARTFQHNARQKRRPGGLEEKKKDDGVHNSSPQLRRLQLVLRPRHAAATEDDCRSDASAPAVSGTGGLIMGLLLTG